MPRLDTLPRPEEFSHRSPLQIRFNDVDILGHVNNTVYLSFYDTGKALYFQAVKKGKMNFRNVETVIANVDCAYIEPIYFGEEIEVFTKLQELGRHHIVLRQMIYETSKAKVKSVCDTVMVYIDKETLTPINVPQQWAALFKEYESTPRP